MRFKFFDGVYVVTQSVFDSTCSPELRLNISRCSVKYNSTTHNEIIAVTLVSTTIIKIPLSIWEYKDTKMAATAMARSTASIVCNSFRTWMVNRSRGLTIKNQNANDAMNPVHPAVATYVVRDCGWNGWPKQ